MRAVLFIFYLTLFFSACLAQIEQLVRPNIALSVEECLAQAQEKEEEGDLKEASRFINIAATIHWEKKENEKAIALFHRSLKLNEKIDNIHGIAGIYSNLGMLYADIRDYPKSLECFEKVLAYRKKGKDKVSIISALINTSVVLNNLKQYNRSAQLLEDALDLAREMNDANQMKSCYGMLAETYEKAGNHERTIFYFNLYRSFHELTQREKERQYRSLAEEARLRAELLAAEAKNKELALQIKNQIIERQQSELSSKDAQNRALLETKTKQELILMALRQQAEIEKIERQREAQAAQAKLKVASLWRNIFILGFSALAIISIILYQFYNNKKRSARQLASQNKAIAEQKEQILQQKLALESAYQEIQEKNTALERSLLTIQEQQNELIQKEKLAAAARLSANIAHEVNTPLGVITSYAEQSKNRLKGLLEKLLTLYPLLKVQEIKYLARLIDTPNRLVSLGQEKEWVKEWKQTLGLEPATARKLMAIGFYSIAELEEAGIDYRAPYFKDWIELAYDLHFHKEALNTILLSVSKTSSIVELIGWFVQRSNNNTQSSSHLGRVLEKALEPFSNYWSQDKIQLRIDWESLDFEYFINDKDLVFIYKQLLENAIYAMEGRGTLSVFAQQGEEDNKILCIQNTGKPISAEEAQKLFEPFYTTKNLGEGIGLGLYITKQMLLTYGAEISCSLQNGHTLFSIVLPAVALTKQALALAQN
jgi:signal transduction histidine kinase